MKKHLFYALSIIIGAAMLGGCNNPTNPSPEPPVGEFDITTNPTFAEGEYLYNPINGNTANYYVVLSEMAIDNALTNTPTFKGGGYVVYINMHAPKSTDMIIPSGDYVYDNSGESEDGLRFDSFTNILTVDKDGKETDLQEITSGKLKVERTGDQYTIVLEGKNEEGKTVYCKYVGKIKLTEPILPDPSDVFPLIKENIDATFTGVVRAAYFGLNDKGAGKFLLQLGDAQTIETNDGTMLDIELFSTVVDNKYVIAPGTYTIANTGEANTLAPGWIDETAFVNYGTNCTQVVYEQGDPKGYYGFASEGTIIFALEGDKYTVTIDLISKNGKTIKGTYTGPIAVKNRSFMSTITDNVEVDLTGIDCEIEFFGNILADKGIDGNVWDVYITPENGTAESVIMLRLVSPAGGKFEDGIPEELYPISRDYAASEVGIALPGEQSQTGEVSCCWYLHKVTAWFAEQAAPLVEGDVAFEMYEGQYMISAFASDDAPTPHEIMFNWLGTPKYIDKSKTNAPHAINFKSSVKRHPGMFQLNTSSTTGRILQRNYLGR